MSANEFGLYINGMQNMYTTVDRTRYKHTSKGVKNASVISTNVYFCALQNVSNYVSWISIYIICTYGRMYVYTYIHTYLYIYTYMHYTYAFVYLFP